MTWEDGDLQEGLERAFGGMERELVKQLRPIISVNLARGRVRHFLEGQDEVRPGDYVWRVAEIYGRTRPYVYEVQVVKSEVVWQPLYHKLKRWAVGLQRSSFHREWFEVEQLAAEGATDAATQIIASHFPYDTEFDAWAYTLLRYTLLKQFNRSKRQKQVPEEKLVDLDTLLPRLGNTAGLSEEQLSNWRFDLLAAMERLTTPARRQVLWLRYFEGCNYEEIAVQLNRTIGAVYKLHFEAIVELRKYFGENKR
jgi:RNA polymerase sigma factor (sigma-70 family)